MLFCFGDGICAVGESRSSDEERDEVIGGKMKD
jgi:hypothetical protein